HPAAGAVVGVILVGKAPEDTLVVGQYLVDAAAVFGVRVVGVRIADVVVAVGAVGVGLAVRRRQQLLHRDRDRIELTGGDDRARADELRALRAGGGIRRVVDAARVEGQAGGAANGRPILVVDHGRRAVHLHPSKVAVAHR